MEEVKNGHIGVVGLWGEGVLPSSQPSPAQLTMVSMTSGEKLHCSEWVLACGSQHENLTKKGMQWCVKYVALTIFKSDFPAGFASWWQSIGVNCSILTHSVRCLLVLLGCMGTPPNLSWHVEHRERIVLWCELSATATCSIFQSIRWRGRRDGLANGVVPEFAGESRSLAGQRGAQAHIARSCFGTISCCCRAGEAS